MTRALFLSVLLVMLFAALLPLLAAAEAAAPVERMELARPVRQAACAPQNGCLALATEKGILLLSADSARPDPLPFAPPATDYRLYWLRADKEPLLGVHRGTALALYSPAQKKLITTLELGFAPADGGLLVADADNDGADELYFFNRKGLCGALPTPTGFDVFTLRRSAPGDPRMPPPTFEEVHTRFSPAPVKRLRQNAASHASAWAAAHEGGADIGLVSRQDGGPAALQIFSMRGREARQELAVPLADEVVLTRCVRNASGSLHLYTAELLLPLKDSSSLLPRVRHRLAPTASPGQGRTWQSLYAPFLPPLRPDLAPPLRFPILESSLTTGSKEAFLNLASRQELELRLAFLQAWEHADTGNRQLPLRHRIVISGDAEWARSFLDIRIERTRACTWLLYRSGPDTVTLVELLPGKNEVLAGRVIAAQVPAGAVFIGMAGDCAYWQHGASVLLRQRGL